MAMCGECSSTSPGRKSPFIFSRACGSGIPEHLSGIHVLPGSNCDASAGLSPVEPRGEIPRCPRRLHSGLVERCFVGSLANDTTGTGTPEMLLADGRARPDPASRFQRYRNQEVPSFVLSSEPFQNNYYGNRCHSNQFAA